MEILSGSAMLAMIDRGQVFEQLPHPIVLLSPDLTILGVNAAGRRFFGTPDRNLLDMPLFDVLPPAIHGRSDWQSRLRASYVELLRLQAPVTLVLVSPEAGIPERSPALPAGAPSKLTADSVMWHVCHGPIIDGTGKLIAIATHAVALRGIEVALVQRADLPPSQLFTVDCSVLPVVDIPIARPGIATATGQSSSDFPDSGAGAAAIPHPGTGWSVLLVEDNQDLRSSTEELMQFLGHRVVSVPDAEQALRQLESSSFDVLFTDLTLPKMSGAELARHVLQHHRPTRVIITSGYGRAMANAQNLDAVFLPKPYRVADLEEVMVKLPTQRA
ncbi:MAG: response regulator [Herminiimonas sp.]|nr:response regulator [Herminiimonas sp.]